MSEEILNNNTEDKDEEVFIPRKKRHTKPEDNKGKFFALRQILNIIFMLGAVVAVVLVLMDKDTYGMIVAVIAMAFKMAECVLRYVK